MKHSFEASHVARKVWGPRAFAERVDGVCRLYMQHNLPAVGEGDTFQKAFTEAFARGWLPLPFAVVDRGIQA